MMGRPRQEVIGYDAIHWRIRQIKQKSTCCNKCGKQARLELANIRVDKIYTLNTDDYEYMCVKCHRNLDGLQHLEAVRSMHGERNPNTKLSKKQVIEILIASKTRTIAELSREYGVSWSTIERIKKRNSWKSITDAELSNGQDTSKSH